MEKYIDIFELSNTLRLIDKRYNDMSKILEENNLKKSGKNHFDGCTHLKMYVSDELQLLDFTSIPECSDWDYIPVEFFELQDGNWEIKFVEWAKEEYK